MITYYHKAVIEYLFDINSTSATFFETFLESIDYNRLTDSNCRELQLIEKRIRLNESKTELYLHLLTELKLNKFDQPELKINQFSQQLDEYFSKFNDYLVNTITFRRQIHL